MKKINLFLVILALLFSANINLQAQLALPTSGGYYQIKNFYTDTLSTSEATYIGGSGAGVGAVKHETAATDPTYQLFLVAGDNEAGWTLKQIRTYNFLTHDNTWNAAYAAATGNNRQLFKFDNTTSNDFIVILKKKDDATFAAGVGFDNATPGQTVFMDKGTDKNNKWLFVAATEADAIAARKAQMVAYAATAQSALDATDNPGYYNATELTNAINGSQSATTFATIDTAIIPLEKAINNYNTIMAAYKPLKDELNAAKILIGSSDYPGKTAFQTAIDAALAVFNQKTDQSAAIASAVTALKNAKKDYVLSQTTGEGTFDITAVLANWGFDSNCLYKATTPASNLGSANAGTNIKTIEGWARDIYGDNSAAASYEYGYAGQLNGQVIPAAAYEGSAGALGISAAWSATVTYKQDVTLPSGKYTLVYAAYNVGPVAADNSKTGWVPTSGTSVLSNRTSFPVGQWVSDTLTFTLAAETAGAIQVGITSPNAGSGGVGRIYFDHVKVFYTSVVIKDALQAAIAKAKIALGDSTRTGSTAFMAAIDTAQAVVDNEAAKQPEVNEATSTLIEKTEQFYMSAVTSDKPMDVTSWVVNPTFTSNANGWITTTGASNKGIATNQTGDFTGPFWENWKSSPYTGKLYQTIPNIPNGKYKLKMAVFNNNQKVPYADWMYLYANKGKTPITTNTPTFYEVFGMVMNDTLEIGIEMTEAIANWVGIDNASLTYYGFSVNYLKDDLQARVTAAEVDFPTTTPMQKTVATALANALTSGKAVLGNDTTATQQGIEDATEALIAATTAAAGSKASYSLLAVALADADTTVAHNDTLPGKAAYQSAIGTIKTAYTAGSYDAAGVDQALANLKAAKNLFFFTAATSYPFDATFAIENPSFETGNINGWIATSGTGDMGSKPISNATYAMTPVDGDYVFNIWAGSSMNFFVEQEVTGLPDGLYTVKALVASDAPNVISIYLNGVTKSITLTTPKETASEIVLGNVRIKNGKAVLGAKSNSWFKADHFRLSYMPLVDMTSTIVNPGIIAANNDVVPEGWTIDKGVGNTFSTTGQHYSGVSSNRYLDSWNPTAGALNYIASQVVDSIPNGVYQLKVAARSSGKGAYVFANNKQIEIIDNKDTGGTLGKGWNTMVLDSVIVMDSTLTIGAKTTTGWTGNWFSADDFALQFVGEGDSITYRNNLKSIIADINAFMANTPNGEDALMQAVIAKVDTAIDLFAAYTELLEAYEVLKPSAVPYSQLKTQYSKDSLLAKTTNYAGLAAYNTAISAAEAVLTGANTLTADVLAAIDALKAASFAYQVSQNAPANFSFIMANPSFEEGRGGTLTPGSTTGGNLDLPLGWNVTRNSGAHNSLLYTTNPYDGKTCYEMWSSSITYFGIDQAIETPRAGFYTLSAVMRSDQNTSKTGSFNDAHVYANVKGDSLISGYLGNAPGFIYGSGWNTVAAWRKLSVSFKADSGEVIKIGAAATCFLQFDNFRLTFLGENDPSIIDVGYISKQKTMKAGADTVTNDAIYRMLAKDTLVKVHQKIITDVSATSPIDLGLYDVLIIQESMGGGDKILTPAGPLALSKLPIPTLYNKTYAFKKGRALTNGGSAAGAETEGVFTITVDPAKQSNDLFKGVTFVDNQAALLTIGADDEGGDTKNKALNFANAVEGAQESLLGYPTGSTPTLSFNDIPAGDTIGGEIVKSRIITFGINFGAICRDNGANVTSNQYTLWRNAVYMLAGLPVPTTPVIIDGVKSAAVTSFDIYPNPTSDRLNINGLEETSIVRIYNLTGKQLFVGKAEQATMSIDLSSYDKGLYLLKVESNGKSITSKVIKN